MNRPSVQEWLDALADIDEVVDHWVAEQRDREKAELADAYGRGRRDALQTLQNAPGDTKRHRR